MPERSLKIRTQWDIDQVVCNCRQEEPPIPEHRNTDLYVDNSFFRQLLQCVGKLYERPNELDQLSLGALDVSHLRAAESHAMVILVLGVVKVE